MAQHDVSEHRIMASIAPDGTQFLPDPIIMRAEAVECIDGRIVGSGRVASGLLPREAIVRELRDADLSCPEGVVALLSILGIDLAAPIDIAGVGVSDHVRLAGASFLPPPNLIEGFYVDHGTDHETLAAVAIHGPRTGMLRGMIRSAEEPYQLEARVRCGEWGRVAQRLRLVRAAVNHYLNHREGTDVADAWVAEGFGFRADKSYNVARPPTDVAAKVAALRGAPQAQAWRTFVGVHAQMLRDHHPPLVVWLSDDDGCSARITGYPTSLASALMTQLHNLIVDGVEIRRCANETCRRPFARQRGRATKGQFRSSGVIYCDAACAKAQMQREYRRRNRQRTAEDASAAEG